MNNKIMIVLFFLILLMIGLSSFDIKNKTKKEQAEGRFGMVSSAHPIATDAGLDILKKGGNAFDAAVAVASTLNVVEPMMSGIGGYGTILIYDAEKSEILFLDSSGKIPAKVNSDVFRKPYPNHRENRRSAKAVSTPGNVNAWDAMSKKYGKLKWKRLFQTAIRVAENGFILDERAARLINYAFETFPKHAKGFYGKNGKPLKAGERLIQKDLASSLKLIALNGPEIFYRGKLGKAIDREMSKQKGFLSIKDLANDSAEWWEPIHIKYRDYAVYTASPPSTAFPSLIRLGLMAQFDVSHMGHNTLKTLHTFIEVTKHAFWCRLRYAGDPEVNPPPLDLLLSKKYLKEKVSKINLKKATPFRYPGKEETDKHTTHFVVADRWGNVVSATQTLGNSFGSRIMPQGTGIWLNNSLAYCTFEPKGNPMDAHPGRRKLSGDCPTIIVFEGKPRFVLGTPGGHTIGQTVPQMVMNLIDFGMNIQEAITAPRVSFLEPDRIGVEEDIHPDIRDMLKTMGHKIYLIKKPWGLGNAHALSIKYGKDGNIIRFFGASDPRGRGLAKGY